MFDGVVLEITLFPLSDDSHDDAKLEAMAGSPDSPASYILG